MPDVHVPPTATERFEAFLEAADHLALEMLLTEGINPRSNMDREEYYGAHLTELTEEFCSPYEHSDIDFVMHYQEAEARIIAAHMVGLALGLRLAGRHGLGGVR